MQARPMLPTLAQRANPFWRQPRGFVYLSNRLLCYCSTHQRPHIFTPIHVFGVTNQLVKLSQHRLLDIDNNFTVWRYANHGTNIATNFILSHIGRIGLYSASSQRYYLSPESRRCLFRRLSANGPNYNKNKFNCHRMAQCKLLIINIL